MRDPRKNPEVNDRLYDKDSEKFLIVDFVTEKFIYYRKCLGDDVLSLKKCSPARFKEMALKQCRGEV